MFTSQTGNHAGADIVGGDKTVIHNYNSSASAIVALYLRLRSNESQESYTAKIADKLQHYCDISSDGDVRGLEDKLSSSNRTYQLKMASRLKESASKTIMKLQTSPIAQDIITYLLSQLYSDFMLQVTPAIESGASGQVVDSLINEKVIAPAMHMLGENDLAITNEDVLGLLFFLGGNCHIRWDKC